MTRDNPPLQPLSGDASNHLSLAVICLPNEQGELDTQWLEAIRAQAVNQSIYTLPRLAKQHDLRALKNIQLGSPRWLSALSEVIETPTLVLKSGLAVPVGLDTRLQALINLGRLPSIVALPGNYAPALNPLSQLRGDFEPLGIDGLVWNVCEASVAPIEPQLEASVCAALVIPAAEADNPEPSQSKLALTDCCYILDHLKPLHSSQALSPLTQDALGVTRGRLEQLARAGYNRLAPVGLDGKPVTLHISHDWGGGIARWIQDLCDHDSEGHHLVLASTAPPDSAQYGQKLVLYAHGPGHAPIQECWLDPVIADTCVHHQAYEACIQWVSERFGIGRIMVSSLIGHSLDCLTQALPTAQVLHDFYPASPVLDVDPLIYHTTDQGLDLKGLIQDRRKTFKFLNESPDHWASLRQQWLDVVSANHVELIAPSLHVIDRWQRLFDHKLENVHHIAHGFDCPPQWARGTLEMPEFESDDPLHLVVIGRISSGKGLMRLQEVAKHYRTRIHFTVLGGGFEAMQLFGLSNIDVVLDYNPASLPDKLKAIAPHGALFLSKVPETWNYVLSEVRCLGLGVIAPRIGSFEERIQHAFSGLLYEPSSAGLIDLLDDLLANQARLPQAPFELTEPSMADAIKAYGNVIPAKSSGIGFSRHSQISQRSIGNLNELIRQSDHLLRHADETAEQLHATIRHQADAIERLDRTVKERTQWALDLDQAFEERTQWALDLDQTLRDREHELQQQIQTNQALSQELAQFEEQRKFLEALKLQLTAVEAERDAAREAHTAVYQQLTQLQEQHADLQAEMNLILTSRSWRLTRPLRVGVRILSAARQRRAWHPVNWVRQSKRLIHAIRVHGWRTTLEALQHHRPLDSNQASDIEPVSAPELDDIPTEIRFEHAVPSDQAIEVSIVIPVYNNLAYTARCLESLVEHHAGQAIEIIVVDDCSSDQTADFLDRCHGIEVIHNAENLGFIGSCNAGARKARGEYQVFLNNDTQVTDQWLTALLEPFSTRADTGIVGARLVYPSGELQEAGGIIFNDGSGWNYGRLGPATTSRVQFVSETDYVSGACLAIRAETFDSLGGFDTHYSPAYYEDTDLCFKVRELGLKVIYQPQSTVIHFEGISSGTSESSGTKRYQAVNREKFKKRWAKQLASHPDPVPGPQATCLIEKARHHRAKGHVLVIDAVTPQPDHDSGSLRMLAILELLVEMGYRVSFMPINLAWDGRYSETLQAKGIETIRHPEISSPSSWLQTYGGLLDWVIGSRYYVLDDVFADIKKHAPQARIMFDTVDLHFLREQRKAALENDAAMAKAAESTKKIESDLIEKSDTTLVVSSIEKDLLNEQIPAADIRILSNIHTATDTAAPRNQRSGLLFVGGFQHPPNVDAARWLIEDILPKLRSKDPNIELHLVGSRMPEWLQNTHAPGLYNHGFVEDLMPHLTGRKVALAPLRYGAGVKGKVNQAMAHGIPVVATSMAAEGLHTEHDVDILIADDTDSFVDEIIRVYHDEELWQRLSEGGLANVEAHFSRKAARQVLEDILSQTSSG